MELEAFCGKDATYFRNRPRPAFFSDLKLQPFDQNVADRAINGNVTVISRSFQFPDKRIDFLYDVTADDPPQNPEWVWQLNRMAFWIDMSLTYLRTGDEKYAIAFDRQLNDWIDLPPERAKLGNSMGSAWRTIECGLRLMKSWQIAFEVFRKSQSVSDRTLEKMIFSMIEQAEYCYQHRTGKNWLCMEMCGCCTLASLFPELPGSSELWEKAKNCLESEVIAQMLPDGVQNELSSDYQLVVFGCGAKFFDLSKCAGLEKTLSADFMRSLEKYAESTLALATPPLTQPRTNDSFTIPSSLLLSQAAKIFPERKDFLWGATDRKQGTVPSGTSRNLPYSGFTAMRSGWDKDALYLCFDHGPLGLNHIHQDKLNIQLYKGDDELLFDDGGGEYECSVHRVYGISAYNHNTVLVDGKAQFRKEPKKTDISDDAGFVTNDRFDYAKGIYDQEFAPFEKYYDDTIPGEILASHQREILFIRPDYFCITDTLKSLDGQVHDYTMRLHMNTLHLKQEQRIPGAYRTEYGKKYDLLIVPLKEPDAASVHSEQLEPYPSGWYVGRNDEHLHPASTLEISMNGKTDAFFATLLFPLTSGELLPEITKLPDGNTVKVCFHSQVSVIRLHELALLDPA